MRPNHDATASAYLTIDGFDVDQVHIPQVAGHLSFWGMDIGRDAGQQVSPAYSGEFAFPDQVLDKVVIRFIEQADAPTQARLVEMAE